MENIVDLLIEFANKIGGWVTVACILIGVVLKFRSDIVYKTVRTIGKQKLMDLLLKLNEMTQDMTIDDMDKFITEFKKEYMVKMEMKGAAIDLSAIFTINKELNKPNVNAVLREYRRRKEYGVLKNKKQWRRVRHDPAIDKALDAILNTMMERYNLQAASSRKKAARDQVETLIKCIRNDENIMKNREKRKQIEAINDDLRAKEKDLDLEKIKKKLCDVFHP